MSDNKFLDEFLDSIDESDYCLESELMQKILRKTVKKTKKRWFALKNIAVALLAVAFLSSFIPSTPVFALRQMLFSYIPGLGVVQNNEGTGIVKSVLAEPVKVTEGQKFVEITTAYLVDQTLTLIIKTNVGAADAGEFKDAAEFKRFFAEKSVPGVYLLAGDEKIGPGSWSSGGPSWDTRTYSINASFSLNNELSSKESFEIALGGFNKIIGINLSPTQSDAAPENLGNHAMVGQIMVIANSMRNGDVLQVVLSAVAPKQFRNPRFQLFDWEKKGFKEELHVIDKEGNVYRPDNELKRQLQGNSDTFYFRVPQNKEGLKVIVPQILYSKEGEDNFKIKMPQVDSMVPIGREINLGGQLIKIEKATIVPANDQLLPEEFKKYECLRIDFSAKQTEQTQERILRVLPQVKVPDVIFGYIRTSSGSYADLWEPGQQNGYALIEFEKMAEVSKIILSFEAEFAMTGPWEIAID